MNLRAFAENLLAADTLAGKLAPPPDELTDDLPGPAVRVTAPVRPPHLAIAPARQVKVPRALGMSDPAQRARILHALANHELQAAELFAWALLAFPDAPGPFRRGLVAILGDEQRHCQMYIERLQALGGDFGDYPVTGHFWHRIADVTSPLGFVCTMGLTFENANLDFAGDYAREAEKAGDLATRAVLEVVHADEIRHVRFAWTWLHKLPAAVTYPSAWDKYLAHVAWPLGPARARGKELDRSSREAAGLDSDFIDHLDRTTPTRPSGQPR